MIKIMRLRLADDLPMMLERTYLPMKEFIGLTKEKSNKNLYMKYLEKIMVRLLKLLMKNFQLE